MNKRHPDNRQIGALVESVRVRQWYKNTLLFLGIVFAGKLGDPSSWAHVILAFVLFCLLSAGEYLLNDVLDRERDRRHPVKRRRPIASGRLSVRLAVTVALSLFVTALAASLVFVGLSFFALATGFVLLVLTYSLVLKHHVIADVLALATGFVLRAVAGCLAIDVLVSPWLIICTFLLALFLVLEKRWGEVVALREGAALHRASLEGLSEGTLTVFAAISGGALLVAYMIYVSLSEFEGLYITVPFAIYGIFRYLYLVHDRRQGSSPDELLADRPTIANLALWVLLVLAVVVWNTVV